MNKTMACDVCAKYGEVEIFVNEGREMCRVLIHSFHSLDLLLS